MLNLEEWFLEYFIHVFIGNGQHLDSTTYSQHIANI